jgi:hypothetical protein
MANLYARGGWLSISDEIFNTGAEHRFIPKAVAEIDSWRRRPHSEIPEDDDPAQSLFDRVNEAYRGGDFPDVIIEQLIDRNKIQA